MDGRRRRCRGAHRGERDGVRRAVGRIGRIGQGHSRQGDTREGGQLTKLSRLNGQYISLAKRVKKCPASSAVLTSTGKQRTAAMKKARGRSLRVLKAKNTRLSKAVATLAKFEGRCAPQLWTITNVVSGSPQTSQVGARFGGVHPHDSVRAGIAADRPDPSARRRRASGRDPARQPGRAHDRRSARPTALRALDRLLEVRRISDTVIQLVPQGPLATLRRCSATPSARRPTRWGGSWSDPRGARAAPTPRERPASLRTERAAGAPNGSR